MRWLHLAEVLELHRRLIQQSGGISGLRDLVLLEASLAQPRQSDVSEGW
jgi:death-on-curing protein